MLSVLFLVVVFLGSYFFLKTLKKRQIWQSLNLVNQVTGADGEPAVVWISNSQATDGWSGDSGQVRSQVVETMLEEAIKALKTADSVVTAWTQILPCGNDCSGKKIAIKVNFNNSYGSGTGNNCYHDHCPTYQVINALLDQLINKKGISPGDINVYDTSRSFPDYFNNGISARFSGVKLNQYQGEGSSLSIKGTSIGRALAEADYLINMPLLRAHGMASITLSFKNHLGSTVDPSKFHGGFFGSSLSNNSLVQLNNQAAIKQKTILVVADALYGLKNGGPNCNNGCSQDGNFFTANSLFLSTDPVAVDSVMIDYMQSVRQAGWEDERNPRITYYTAAQNGLGNYATSCTSQNICSFVYTNIKLVKCEDGSCSGGEPTPTSAYSQGDINLDEIVNNQDALDFFPLYRANHWLSTYAPDPDGDGLVSLDDFGWIISDW